MGRKFVEKTHSIDCGEGRIDFNYRPVTVNDVADMATGAFDSVKDAAKAVEKFVSHMEIDGVTIEVGELTMPELVEISAFLGGQTQKN